MCHVKAIKFACGHVCHKILSGCRLTFANPDKTQALCRSEPSLYLDHAVSCRECEFQKFQAQWEARFEDARKRKVFVQEVMPGHFEDKSWMEDDNDDCAEGAETFWADAGEAASRAKELTTNDNELSRLYDQYHREMWLNWQWYVEVPWDTKQDNARAPKKPKRTKRPGRRCSETSPLRKVISVDDVEDEEEEGGGEGEDLFYSDSSNYSSTNSSRANSSAGSCDSSPVWPNFEWTEYQWEDDESFADTLSGALEELNCRKTSC